MEFLTVNNGRICYKGKAVRLQGINLGGWLMMEGYILHAPNVAEQVFKKHFGTALGEKELLKFEKCFRDHFIGEEDIAHIARLGFNVLRVPFNSRLIETQPYKYSVRNLLYLDKLIAWARKHKIWVILDLHAACGAQNHDWHSDSLGPATLWSSKVAQKRTLALWEFLANRYKNETAVAGYDLLNEAVVDNAAQLNQFYKDVIKSIRAVDRKHLLFIEGNKWATDLECLADFKDEQVVLSIHFYEPIAFTFNFEPQLKYPLNTKNHKWNSKVTGEALARHVKVARQRNRPVLVGEFGVNVRQGLYGETQWLAETLEWFEQYDFHWTYWTYKAVKNSMFPDGLYSYLPNSPWVNRHGPKSGWETYAMLWREHHAKIMASWKTKEFRCNREISSVLKPKQRLVRPQ